MKWFGFSKPSPPPPLPPPSGPTAAELDAQAKRREQELAEKRSRGRRAFILNEGGAAGLTDEGLGNVTPRASGF